MYHPEHQQMNRLADISVKIKNLCRRRPKGRPKKRWKDNLLTTTTETE